MSDDFEGLAIVAPNTEMKPLRMIFRTVGDQETQGYNAHSIEAMERGRYNMDIKLLGRIADALGCEIKLVNKQ